MTSNASIDYSTNTSTNGTDPLPPLPDVFGTIANLHENLQTLSVTVEITSANFATGLLILVSSLIFFMQAGFAFLETGAVRAGKEKLVLFKNFLVLCVGSLAFWAIGYALGYGDGNSFIGAKYFFLQDFHKTPSSYALWLSNFVFAATTSTVATGAMAERAKLISYLAVSFFVSGMRRNREWFQFDCLVIGFIHPVVAHWAWTSEGWLAKGVKIDNVTVSYDDFAGSGVVHVAGGTIAFLGAAVLGPRIGRFDDYGKPVPIGEKTATMSALGGFILFFGFLLFISGRHRSVWLREDQLIFGRLSINTILAGSSGALAALILVSILNRRNKSARDYEQLVATLNGCLAGLVAICAGASSVHGYAACVIGIIAGLTYRVWTKVILKYKVDDPMESVSVHLGAGIWGVIASGLFDIEKGLFYNWTRVSVVHLLWTLAGLAAIIGWAAATSAILFGILHTFNLLHLSRADELHGLEGENWSRKQSAPMVVSNQLNDPSDGSTLRKRKSRTSGTSDPLKNDETWNEILDEIDKEKETSSV